MCARLCSEEGVEVALRFGALAPLDGPTKQHRVELQFVLPFTTCFVTDCYVVQVSCYFCLLFIPACAARPTSLVDMV